MRANAHAVQSQEALQALVHFRDLLGRDQSARNVGLIGDQDQSESGIVEPGAGFSHAGEQAQVRKRGRRIRLALLQDNAVDHSIAI